MYAQDLGGEVGGNEFDFLVGLAGGGRCFAAVVVVIDVTAGAIGQQCHEGPILMFMTESGFNVLAKLAEVVGGKVVASHATHVVEPVVGHEGDWAAIGSLHGEAIDFGVGGASGTFEAEADAAAGIHDGAILFAERIDLGQAVFKQVAAVEDMLGELAAAPGDAGRFQIVHCAAHPIDHTRDDELTVV